MTRVRAIYTELVERKLWPVVLVLVIAAIALPIALGGGSDKAATPVPATQSPVTANAQPAAVVSVTDVASGKKRNRKGSIRDPFVQQHVAAPAPNGATGTATSGAGPATNLTPASNLDMNYGANPVAGDSPTNGSTPTVHVPAANTKYVYRVAVLDREAGEGTIHVIGRNDRVPSKNDPLAVFVGVMADKKTAVFVMNRIGQAKGSGTCRPSRRACVTFELKRGESMLLTLPQPNGTVRRVRLVLGGIVVGPKAAKISSKKR
jgi:hypothetical protein